MNANAFRDLWARMMFSEVSKRRVTNHEMHSLSYDFHLLDAQQNYSPVVSMATSVLHFITHLCIGYSIEYRRNKGTYHRSMTSNAVRHSTSIVLWAGRRFSIT